MRPTVPRISAQRRHSRTMHRCSAIRGRTVPILFHRKLTRLCLDRLARRANGKAVVEVPSTHGFCVYLRRDCVKEVGLFREDLFAQGYGEENDFCIRARHLGWRHVAVPGLFVAHAGAGSFGSAKAQLMARNLAILNRLHPGYDRLIASFRQADPLAQSRFRMDALRWRRRRSRKGAVVLVTHARSGGVKRRVAERCHEIAASGVRPIVLAPATDAYGRTDLRARGRLRRGFSQPALRHGKWPGSPQGVPARRQARQHRIASLHWPSIRRMLGLANALNVPYDVVVHDYAWVCPRVTLVGPDKRYCGEPGGDACEACYSDIGGNIEEDIRPSRLRLRSRAVLIGARQVVVPSHDVAARLRHYVPELACVVTPWEDDVLPHPPADHRVKRLRMRVVVVGAIGIEKGYEYLLACARHVATHRLALEFVVVGHTSDDKRLLETGSRPYHRSLRGGRGCRADPVTGCGPWLPACPVAGNLELHAHPALAGRAGCGGIRPRCPGGADPRDAPRQLAASWPAAGRCLPHTAGLPDRR